MNRNTELPTCVAAAEQRGRKARSSPLLAETCASSSVAFPFSADLRSSDVTLQAAARGEHGSWTVHPARDQLS